MQTSCFKQVELHDVNLKVMLHDVNFNPKLLITSTVFYKTLTHAHVITWNPRNVKKGSI